MLLFDKNPKVKEVNKYLNETVASLLKKHGKISNPDFEKELTEITGVSWKQVKNYKNHPNPSQRLRDNALIIKYVKNERKKHRIKRILITSNKAFPVIILVVVGLYYLYTSLSVKEAYIFKTITQFKSNSKPTISFKPDFSLDLPFSEGSILLGPIANSSINLKHFNCTEIQMLNQKNCQKTIGKLGRTTITIILEDDFVRKFTVLTTEKDASRFMESRLENSLISNFRKSEGRGLAHLSSTKYSNQNEEIEIMRSKDDDKSPVSTLMISARFKSNM